MSSRDAGDTASESGESCHTQLTELTELTELSELDIEQPAKRRRDASPERDPSGDELNDEPWVRRHFSADVFVSFDGGATHVGIARTRRMPGGSRIGTRAEAANAISDWLNREFKPFRCDRAGKRDAQQLRRQPVGAVTLYFNWGPDAVVGLRKKTSTTIWPQQPVKLASRTGLLLQKEGKNSTTVSLCKGDASCFWAFEGQDDGDIAECGECSPGASQRAETEEEEEEEPPPRQKVLVRSLPALHRYQGLRGFIEDAGQKISVVFPCGAPSKRFSPEHLEHLPENASMRDRLTCGRVWLRRGPGVGAWGMRHLRAQRRHRAIVRMVGWNAYYKRFVVAFDDRMEPHHMVHLTFAQTGIVRGMEEEASDSDDPKACDSSEEK